jgi:formylglycine-generating enzyme required for sulfatase activity
MVVSCICTFNVCAFVLVYDHSAKMQGFTESFKIQLTSRRTSFEAKSLEISISRTMKSMTHLRRITTLAALFLMVFGQASAQSTPKSWGSQTLVHGVLWDVHEVTVAQVKEFANQTGFVSRAEKEGGGQIYEAGFVQKKGWTWRTPFGKPAQDLEPAVHITFDEAQQICRFKGRRLPTDTEWVKAAFVEQRDNPPPGYVKGQRYPYPMGASAKQSHCLSGCGNYAGSAPQGSLWRGVGHVPVMTTPPGVNGLFDMGGNVWEWVDTGTGDEKITRGASWWYDADRQKESDVATKPKDTRVGYIGFRCIQDLK